MKSSAERVMYLDVDDTLLVWSNDHMGVGAPRAGAFVHWALEHFEVRWLTCWCPSGQLEASGAANLSRMLGGTVDPNTLLQIVNPLDWFRNVHPTKCDGIDWTDPRPWVWIEDGLPPEEHAELERRQVLDRWFSCNVSCDPIELQRTWQQLAQRFNLPGAPVPPWSTVLDAPRILSVP